MDKRVPAVGLLLLLLSSCGPDEEDTGFIEITNPTQAEEYTTTEIGIGIGGTVARASWIRWYNAATGGAYNCYGPFYHPDGSGNGSWHSSEIILVPGVNEITVTTSRGEWDVIRITRVP